MPVIPKPKETGVPVVDFLYSLEPDVSPTPLAPAITREAVLRAVRQALPERNVPNIKRLTEKTGEVVEKELAEEVVKAIPKRYLEPIKGIYVYTPEAYLREKVASLGLPLPPEAAGALVDRLLTMIPRGFYRYPARTIGLIQDFILPPTVAHEVGHDLFYLLSPKQQERFSHLYRFMVPEDLKALERIGNSRLHNERELFAELFARKMMSLVGHEPSKEFLHFFPQKFKNIPFTAIPER